ncbi:MAG: MotA/TolQ/ExbB proton channel family protein [Fuerstia sp.]|nr:MotA/TolQ/ExbB proton channel family protein [Fuerstiella sp.]
MQFSWIKQPRLIMPRVPDAGFCFLLPFKRIKQSRPEKLARAGLVCLTICLCVSLPKIVFADESSVKSAVTPQSFLSPRELLAAGGTIGYVIIFLSFLMVALIVDYLLTIRRTTFIPPGLAEEVHKLLADRKVPEATKLCEKQPGFMGRMLFAGLQESQLGYTAIEKAMEDTAAEQSARCFRRIEHLSVIGTLAPMLGLMGTVWGMILAFMEFETKANPQISELAPGVYKALVTTLQGLAVAIPATGALAYFRSRVEELSMEASLTAAHVFADFRRAAQLRKKTRPGADADA